MFENVYSGYFVIIVNSDDGKSALRIRRTDGASIKYSEEKRTYRKRAFRVFVFDVRSKRSKRWFIIIKNFLSHIPPTRIVIVSGCTERVTTRNSVAGRRRACRTHAICDGTFPKLRGP